jgi:hypothetical protein
MKKKPRKWNIKAWGLTHTAIMAMCYSVRSNNGGEYPKAKSVTGRISGIADDRRRICREV